MRYAQVTALLFALALPCLAAPTDRLADFLGIWARETGAATAAIDAKVVRAPDAATIRIEHRGKDDWSLTGKARVRVEPGDIYELDAWVRVEGAGSATLCATAYDKDGKVVDWTFGGRTARERKDWQHLWSRLLIPAGVAEIQPRLIGYGPATTWLDTFSHKKTGSLDMLRNGKLPPELGIWNAALSVAFHTADATLLVTDKRTKQAWAQKPLRQEMAVTSATASGGRVEIGLIHVPSGLQVKSTLALDGDLPEMTLSLAAEGDLVAPMAWPAPFASPAGTYLVVPMNEGISYPVEDASIPPMHLVAYGGHGICLAFWGVTDGAAGQMAILETPDDAAIRIDRADGHLGIGPEWESEKGRFGYERRLRYIFLDRGGHVAMCKRYRAYAKSVGLAKPLEEKRRARPSIDLLVGAVNVWCWEKDPVAILKEMRAAGIERVLWSQAQKPDVLKAMNEMPGVLTSRYDIYQDVMDPASYPLIRYTHGDWPAAAWPKDLMLGPGGDWIKGWEIERKDGPGMIPCGTVCDKQAIPYAERRIGDELKGSPYRCRFIDTTTASPWRECWSPDHPMTRRESRRCKMDLLAVVSQKFGLVCGSETGHDAAVPYADYFEGMLSLGPYRVPDSGRDMQRIWTDVPENVAKFQMGHAYRLPLWELVYHDCLVAQWYWGDYNNKLPSLWDKRDLFNVLYATPPMFMFSRKLWEEKRDRFVQSYRNTCPTVRAVGYAEMTDHRFLTPDRSVQQTAFANGVTVTVNFGAAAFKLADGTEVGPMGYHVAGMR